MTDFYRIPVFVALFSVVGVQAYAWVKAAHVIAIIAWMAGMLYLPRLFVYHCDAPRGSVQSETFKTMERRLLRAIINPAMIVAWVLGVWLMVRGNWATAPWMHGKRIHDNPGFTLSPRTTYRDFARYPWHGFICFVKPRLDLIYDYD